MMRMTMITPKSPPHYTMRRGYARTNNQIIHDEVIRYDSSII